jgi:pilus assembly protein CpaF
VEGVLPDGTYLHAILPPTAPAGPTLALERASAVSINIEDLLNYMSLTPEMAMYLEGAMKARLNLLLSSGPGSGGKTFLNALAKYFLGPSERVAYIESEPALVPFEYPHTVRLRAQTGCGDRASQGALRAATRLRPDRLILSEAEGPELWSMLELIDAGWGGSVIVLTARTPRAALMRLERDVTRHEARLPRRVLLRQIANSIDVVVQLSRLVGGPRKVTTIAEVDRLSDGDREIPLRPLFEFQQLGVDQNGRAHGQFVATGSDTSARNRMEALGIRLPTNLFHERVLLRD